MSFVCNGTEAFELAVLLKGRLYPRSKQGNLKHDEANRDGVSKIIKDDHAKSVFDQCVEREHAWTRNKTVEFLQEILIPQMIFHAINHYEEYINGKNVRNLTKGDAIMLESIEYKKGQDVENILTIKGSAPTKCLNPWPISETLPTSALYKVIADEYLYFPDDNDSALEINDADSCLEIEEQCELSLDEANAAATTANATDTDTSTTAAPVSASAASATSEPTGSVNSVTAKNTPANAVQIGGHAHVISREDIVFDLNSEPKSIQELLQAKPRRGKKRCCPHTPMPSMREMPKEVNGAGKSMRESNSVILVDYVPGSKSKSISPKTKPDIQYNGYQGSNLSMLDSTPTKPKRKTLIKEEAPLSSDEEQEMRRITRHSYRRSQRVIKPPEYFKANKSEPKKGPLAASTPKIKLSKLAKQEMETDIAHQLIIAQIEKEESITRYHDTLTEKALLEIILLKKKFNSPTNLSLV